ncbi:glycosyltransferase family 4 protein [Dyadobacter subterraneus]|uniref:Glycosyltransferase family 1 protein n=1 Tax=Dyadobacter subterraneus TaxID=2773304 RepID=A0ABR9WGI9_9BACT|nr:glycosyltransferase family 1 protein [Dyadobacter subterraneus]MBE9464244.1 glycosyltransferase family 1 protein [Dyadobacter subterraneus]
MKKKLAFISEHASPLAVLGGVDSGGQNVYVAEICKQLARLGYTIDIFTRKDSADLLETVLWLPGIRVVHIVAGPEEEVAKEKLLGFMGEFTTNMIHFIQSNDLQYDLVHANFFMSGLVAFNIKGELKIPYVITFHALGKIRMLHQKEKDAFPVERIDIEQMIVHDADQVIAECPQDQQDLVEHYGADPSRITIIPCGFSAREFQFLDKQKARKILNLDQDDIILLQLGRIVPRKGVDNVIRALGKLKHIPKIRLLVVGGADEIPDFDNDAEFKRLKKIAREELVLDSVTFTGRKNRDELKYYYCAADFFISTPWYEPFGITPLEAMACGTPVIGANVGGIKYSVKHNHTGFLVPPHDPTALAEAIEKGLSDPVLYQNLCKKALKRVNDMFTWECVAKKADELYQALTYKPAAKRKSAYLMKSYFQRNTQIKGLRHFV